MDKKVYTNCDFWIAVPHDTANPAGGMHVTNFWQGTIGGHFSIVNDTVTAHGTIFGAPSDHYDAFALIVAQQARLRLKPVAPNETGLPSMYVMREGACING